MQLFPNDFGENLFMFYSKPDIILDVCNCTCSLWYFNITSESTAIQYDVYDVVTCHCESSTLNDNSLILWHQSLGWHQWTTRRLVSQSFIIVLCTKLDAECDWQVMVVGRLWTTLGNDRCAVVKLFLVWGWRKAPEWITLMFGDKSNSVFVW